MTHQDSDIIPPVSNSEMKTWTECRRKWYLSHYREMGVKSIEAPLTGALVMGTAVHAALERMYTTGEDPLAVLEELHSKAVYDLIVRESESGFPDDDTRKKLQSEREMSHAMLEGYVAWVAETGADEGLSLVGAEVTIEVASGIPGVRLRGKLDQRIHRDIDGARLFRDWKTAADFSIGPRMLPLDEQMKMYMLLEKLDARAKTGSEPPEPTRGGLYTMLRKVKRTGRAKPPFYMTVEVHHNDREIESMWLRIHKRINEMLETREQLDAGGDHRYWVAPTPTRDCTWKCPFFAICPIMDEEPEETWNAMLNEYYEPTDPYERYTSHDEIAPS